MQVKIQKVVTVRVEIMGDINFLLFLSIFLKCSIVNTLLSLKNKIILKTLEHYFTLWNKCIPEMYTNDTVY